MIQTNMKRVTLPGKHQSQCFLINPRVKQVLGMLYHPADLSFDG
jgi:hypothetical protein